jgi:hypothetical protein
MRRGGSYEFFAEGGAEIGHLHRLFLRRRIHGGGEDADGRHWHFSARRRVVARAVHRQERHPTAHRPRTQMWPM